MLIPCLVNMYCLSWVKYYVKDNWWILCLFVSIYTYVYLFSFHIIPPYGTAGTFVNILYLMSGLIPGLRPANERRRYFVTTSLIGRVQT